MVSRARFLQTDNDQHYYPTVEDLRNRKMRVISKIHNDQDALENFLNHKREQNKGFKYFLRKYETAIENKGRATSL